MVNRLGSDRLHYDVICMNKLTFYGNYLASNRFLGILGGDGKNSAVNDLPVT